MSSMHCALENGADLCVNERQKIRHYRAIYIGVLKKEEDRMPNREFFSSRGAYIILKIALYSNVMHSFDWKSAIEHDGGV